MTTPSINNLEALRQCDDAIARQAVQAFLTEDADEQTNVITLFRSLKSTSQALPDELPPALQRYFEETQSLPSWADADKIKRGEELFGLYGPEIVLTLFCKSLPLCYSCWRGAEVLAQTGRLELNSSENLEKYNGRIMETAQFIVNVMTPGGLTEKGNGIRTAQKVRLIHAAIREFIQQKDWDETTFGKPINFEDMTGTLMSFSYCALDGLESMGIKIAKADQEAYLHTWNVVGHLLGLPDEVLPANMEEAKDTTHKILKQQAARSDAGVTLTRALIHYMQQKLLRGHANWFPAYMIRYLNDEELANILDVQKPKSRWADLIAHIFWDAISFFEKFIQTFPFTKKLTARLSRLFIQRLINNYNEHKQVTFYIPESLTMDWQLNKTDGQSI